MNKQLLWTGLVLTALILLPDTIFAQVTNNYGGVNINEEVNNIQAFLFGPALRIVGVVGGAIGIFQAIFTSSLKPLLLYGGLGLAVNLIPNFIDGVFGVSGMLIP